MGFDGTVAVVTGGGSGIGKRTAERLAEGGARVAVLDMDGDAAGAVATRITDRGGTAFSAATDVRDAEGVRTAMAVVTTTLGPIGVLVNNAGVATADGLIDITEEDWDRDVSTALGGTYRCTRAVLPGMVERGDGVIVNVSSVNGQGMYGQEAYSAAKAGVESLTRSVAVRYGPAGVRANAVVPGTIATPAWDSRVEANPGILEDMASWYPLGRVGTPDDVASAILFLASDQAAWITGTTLRVDGGLLAGGFRMVNTAVGRQ